MITLAVQRPSFSPGACLGRFLGIKAIADWFSESYDQRAWPGRFNFSLLCPDCNRGFTSPSHDR
jgi:hypothetical protein